MAHFEHEFASKRSRLPTLVPLRCNLANRRLLHDVDAAGKSALQRLHRYAHPRAAWPLELLNDALGSLRMCCPIITP